MNKNSQWVTRRLTFPTIEAWRAFAQGNKVESGYFIGPSGGQTQQEVACQAVWNDDLLCSLVPLFVLSGECGLWVAKDQRGQGVGRKAFSNFLHGDPRRPKQLYSTVSAKNPDAAGMEHLLGEFGFRQFAQIREFRIWRSVLA